MFGAFCLSLVILPMAQPGQMEGRLRTILHSKVRRQALTRKTIAVAALVTAGVVAPLAALRPIARASRPIPHFARMSLTKDQKAPIQEKLAFVKAVHDYNNSLLLRYYGISDAYTQYARAINRKQPERIIRLLASHYTLNGRPLDAKQALQMLQGRIRDYGDGLYRLKVDRVNHSPTHMPLQTTVYAMEHWASGGHGLPGSTSFSRKDVWVNTPQGWKLAASDVKFLGGFVD